VSLVDQGIRWKFTI